MKKLHKNIYVHTTSDGVNIGCIVGEDGAVSIDLPLNTDEALQWREQIKGLTPKPLRAIIFTSSDRVNSDALRSLAPNLGAFSIPAIIQDAGFNQLYAALEAAQPRMLEPLSPVQLRERAVLPDVTFSDSATFTLGLEEPVHIDITNAGGYAPGCSLVTIRDTGVVFTGELVTSHEPPSLMTANIDQWVEVLTNLRRNRKIKTVVPGRGPVGDSSAVAETLSYIKAAYAGVKKLVRSHRSREGVGALTPELLSRYAPASSKVSRERAGAVHGAVHLDASAISQRIQMGLERVYDELTARAAAEPQPE
jgi:glyoxylase-like metal-dependent hydrolase (beta-lactamase superfamily II)